MRATHTEERTQVDQVASFVFHKVGAWVHIGAVLDHLSEAGSVPTRLRTPVAKWVVMGEREIMCQKGTEQHTHHWLWVRQLLRKPHGDADLVSADERIRGNDGTSGVVDSLSHHVHPEKTFFVLQQLHVRTMKATVAVRVSVGEWARRGGVRANYQLHASADLSNAGVGVLALIRQGLGRVDEAIHRVLQLDPQIDDLRQVHRLQRCIERTSQTACLTNVRGKQSETVQRTSAHIPSLPSSPSSSLSDDAAVAAVALAFPSAEPTPAATRLAFKFNALV
jgi:hypothetical protein